MLSYFPQAHYTISVKTDLVVDLVVRVVLRLDDPKDLFLPKTFYESMILHQITSSFHAESMYTTTIPTATQGAATNRIYC